MVGGERLTGENEKVWRKNVKVYSCRDPPKQDPTLPSVPNKLITSVSGPTDGIHYTWTALMAKFNDIYAEAFM